ncbi:MULTISPECIES: hypothetical protein [unclassified Sphingomonas]|nr:MULTISPECIES: hypothetical protein [unclassified Sphingomonas]
MAIILASIGNLAAGAANAAAARPISADAIYWPAWILVSGVLIALLIVIGVLTSLKAALLAKPKKRDEEFTRMLCKQVWRHTATLTDIFAQRLRQPQRDVVTLRVLLRLLREDIAGPVNFVEQMRPHAPSTWPDYELFAAFNNWGGQICAMESQLADMQQMLSYPAVKEPVDEHRDAMLVHFYATEQVAMGQTVSTLGNHAIAVCDAAEKLLKKEPGGFKFGGSEPDEPGHGCPACGASRHSVYAGANARDLLPLPDPPEKPKKKEAPQPVAQLCHCVTPRPCHCTPMPCACACNCKSASAAATAHH